MPVLMALVIALIVALPRLALACPSCAGRDEGNPVFTGILIGSMIFLPFVIAGVVYRLIRTSGFFQPEHSGDRENDHLVT
jgi:hypothetical protein